MRLYPGHPVAHNYIDATKVSGNEDHFNVTCDGSAGNWVDPGNSWPSCVYKCKVPVAHSGYDAIDPSQIVSDDHADQDIKIMQCRVAALLSICRAK